MKKLICFAAITVMMSGCAPPKIIWEKPDSSQQEFNRDVYECTQQTTVAWAGGGTGSMGLIMMAGAKSQAQKQANELFKMCMRARGYTDRIAQEGE